MTITLNKGNLSVNTDKFLIQSIMCEVINAKIRCH